MKKISKGLAQTAVFTGIAFGAFALSAFASGTWTPAPASPPSNNVDAPINVGYSAQIKQGGLILNGLVSAGVPGTYALDVVNAPVKTEGGLIIETRASDPVSPETGRMWLITP